MKSGHEQFHFIDNRNCFDFFMDDSASADCSGRLGLHIVRLKQREQHLLSHQGTAGLPVAYSVGPPV